MKALTRLGVLATLYSLAWTGAASAQPVGPPEPSVTLSVPAATVGQQVSVTGQHFAPVTAMSMQVCGNDARDGSTDCDVVAGQTVLTDEHGEFRSHLNVRFPPVPCPCVVWVTAHDGAVLSATAPIGVIAANYVAPPPSAASSASDVEVVRAELVQQSAWRGWLGLPVSARLHVTIRNPGDTPVVHPVVSLRFGSGSDPSGVLDAPQIDALRGGEQRTIDVPVSLGLLAHGTYTVKGAIGSTPVTFGATTTVVPWVLLLLFVVGAAVGSAALALRGWRRVRAEVPAADTIAPPSLPEPSTDDRVASTSIAVHPETTTVNLTDDDLPPIATDDELVAWGAALVRDVDDVDWLAAGNHLDLEPHEEITVIHDLPDVQPLVDVAFLLPGYEDAHSVSVCGEFNDWSLHATAMEFHSGLWRVIVPLESDRDYRYRFLVNGHQWLDDPFTSNRTPNDFGGHDSVVHTRRVEDFAPESAVSALA